MLQRLPFLPCVSQLKSYIQFNIKSFHKVGIFTHFWKRFGSSQAYALPLEWRSLPPQRIGAGDFTYIKKIEGSVFDFRGKYGHGAFLGADESGSADCRRMRFLYALTLQYAGDEGCREGIAGTYRVFHLYLGSGLE